MKRIFDDNSESQFSLYFSDDYDFTLCYNSRECQQIIYLHGDLLCVIGLFLLCYLDCFFLIFTKNK